MSLPTSPIDMDVDCNDTVDNSNPNVQPSAASKDKSLTDADTDTVGAVALNDDGNETEPEDNAPPTAVETQNLNGKEQEPSTQGSTKKRKKPPTREKAFHPDYPKTMNDNEGTPLHLVWAAGTDVDEVVDSVGNVSDEEGGNGNDEEGGSGSDEEGGSGSDTESAPRLQPSAAYVNPNYPVWATGPPLSAWTSPRTTVWQFPNGRLQFDDNGRYYSAPRDPYYSSWPYLGWYPPAGRSTIIAQTNLFRVLARVTNIGATRRKNLPPPGRIWILRKRRVGSRVSTQERARGRCARESTHSGAPRAVSFIHSESRLRRVADLSEAETVDAMKLYGLGQSSALGN
ncbi:hypothetical protein C8R46DRAFT_1230803 [Mycena filopes]|nr:hypothetical protein C8R46DRAFT_1230803 [Mycena filopes]